MSGTTPEQTPDVYTMPPETYRMDTRAPAPQPDPAPAPAPAGPERSPAVERRRKGWDIALSVVLSLLLIGAAVLGSFGSILWGLTAAASCGGGGRVCQGDLRDLGIWITFTAPWMVSVISLTVTVVLLVRRRRGFWVPLVGLLLAVLVWAVGGFLLWAAV